MTTTRPAAARRTRPCRSCFEEAGLGEAFTSLYCPGTNLEPGTAGYMGPNTDWQCFVEAWDYDCSGEGGPIDGQADANDCYVDPGNVGDDDDDDDDDDATGDDDDDDDDDATGDDDDATGDDDDATGDDDDATGDDDDATGDDDDATGDDDDSTVGDDDDSTVGDDDDDDDATGSTGANALPCGIVVWDIYEIFGASTGDSVFVSIDTVSASTAFDPWLIFADNDTTDPANSTMPTYDDDFICTFPPPNYTCPEGSATVPSGTLYFAVGHASDNCAGSAANYSIDMAVNGGTSNDYWLSTDDWQ